MDRILTITQCSECAYFTWVEVVNDINVVKIGQKLPLCCYAKPFRTVYINDIPDWCELPESPPEEWK